MKLKGGYRYCMNIDNDLRNEILNFSITGTSRVNCLIVYVYMMMYANFKDKTINGIDIKRGQYLTSCNVLAEKTGLSEQNVRTAIKKLIEAGYIKKYSTKKYTILTMCHYDKQHDKKKNVEYKKQSTVANNNLNDNEPIIHQQTDAERYRYLSEEILKRDLTAEEKEFFNNYNGG